MALFGVKTTVEENTTINNTTNTSNSNASGNASQIIKGIDQSGSKVAIVINPENMTKKLIGVSEGKDGTFMSIMFTGVQALFYTLGIVFALWAIVKLDDANAVKARVAALGDHGWLYLTAMLFVFTSNIVGSNAIYRRMASGVKNPDQHVYQLAPKEKDEDKSVHAVVMVADGAAGAFNRAQRGVGNMIEYLVVLSPAALLAGYVAPKVTFFAVLGWGISRILYAVGYSISAGAREAGFMLGMMLFQPTIFGVVLYAGLKATGNWCPALNAVLPAEFV